jgi:hypothetical protein
VTKKSKPKKIYTVKSAREGWMAEFDSRAKAKEYVFQLGLQFGFAGPYWIEVKSAPSS